MSIIKVIITAGGTSTRFGKTNKLLQILNGKPVIQHSADLFTEMGFEIVIPVNMNAFNEMTTLFQKYKNIRIIQGGLTRQQSVFKGLQEIGECDYVIIHDAARPLITKDIVLKGIEAVKDKKAVITAVKTTDTIKIVDTNNKITSTPKRVSLINVQTPQIFDYALIYNAHKMNCDKSMTDDACLVESSGGDVYYIEGEYSNIKITNKIDIDYAEILIKNQS